MIGLKKELDGNILARLNKKRCAMVWKRKKILLSHF